MKRKVSWVMTGCVVAAISILAACSPPSAVSRSPSATTSAKTLPATSPPKTATATTTPSGAQPQYGGRLTFINSNPMDFDPALGFSIFDDTRVTNSELLTGDWTKGPAGTDVTDWEDGYVGHISLDIGYVAQSWELPDDSTIIYHLRHGVHYYVQPGNAASQLVGGRELTADDVVWSANREWTSPKSTLYNFWTPAQRPISFKALDKYTVEVKVPPSNQGNLLALTGDESRIYPPEVVAKYGSFNDWQNQVGTGPFWIEDYVSNSEVVYQRNPDFFMDDPLHPQNQLPYVDEVDQLIITDHSTQLAALRTGKIDVSGLYSDPLTWEDKAEFNSNTKLQWKQVAGPAPDLYGREDKADLPFQNLLVRQAMNLAIDQPGIVKDYYKGNADLLAYPFPPYKAWQDLYTPLNQMPSKPMVPGSQASVQELFTYEPAKAKQLLAEAGYPNGFKTQVMCTASQSDFLSIIKDQLSQVGIDLEINVVDNGVYSSTTFSRSFPQMVYYFDPERDYPSMMMGERLNMPADVAYFSSNVTNAAYAQAQPYVGRDDAKWASIVKGVTPYLLEESAGVWLPGPWDYVAWWPWLKNYDGERSVGYDNPMAFMWYTWIDQSLKKSMGY